MRKTLIDLEETHAFSPIFLDYIRQSSNLKDYYQYFPNQKGFEAALGNRKYSGKTRSILINGLREQYAYLKPHEEVIKSLECLAKDNTYTITTGHQLNVATGPLYFIFKIVTAVNTCRRLKEQFPDHDFIPVYWMASEDHDLEEINHFNVFGKNYTWNTNQTGAVGRMNTLGLEELINTLPESVGFMAAAYRDAETLAEATMTIVNHLFGAYGVVVVEPDSPHFKGVFKRVIQDDLLNHRANDLVEEQSMKLAKAGYKTQIYPRSINLFFLEDGKRERIIAENGKFTSQEASFSFNTEEIKQLIERSPEKFSPNVVLRPVYQELLLPNLAYIGGPAEIAYWLQLKKVFEYYNVFYPVLLPRNFGMVVARHQCNKLQKLELAVKDLFKPIDEIRIEYVKNNSDQEFSLSTEIAAISQRYDEIKQKAEVIDKTLEGFIGAEEAKALKGLENIEKRLRKAEEQKLATSLNQINSLKDKLFPGGGLQERHDNFLNFYLNDPDFIETLIRELDPFDFRLAVFYQD